MIPEQDGNLKICPPLTIDDKEVDHLLSALNDAFK